LIGFKIIGALDLSSVLEIL